MTAEEKILFVLHVVILLPVAVGLALVYGFYFIP
jgi:hypothetical protein